MAALALPVLAMLAVTASAVTPPAPTRWVEDRASFLSPAVQQKLDARLESYQHATGHQVIVWIDKSLGGESLDELANRAFTAWKIGRKGLDDGAAIFVFADDRAIAIEVGYGLEDRLTDARSSRIIREVMAPKLRAGDRDGAIEAGVDEALTAIEGKPWTGGAAASTDTAPPSGGSWIFGAVALLLFLLFSQAHPRLAMLTAWTLMGRGGGFGGMGRGGGGGFHGGGGRSGGGGARGGW